MQLSSVFGHGFHKLFKSLRRSSFTSPLAVEHIIMHTPFTPVCVGRADAEPFQVGFSRSPGQSREVPYGRSLL